IPAVLHNRPRTIGSLDIHYLTNFRIVSGDSERLVEPTGADDQRSRVYTRAEHLHSIDRCDDREDLAPAEIIRQCNSPARARVDLGIRGLKRGHLVRV